MSESAAADLSDQLVEQMKAELAEQSEVKFELWGNVRKGGPSFSLTGTRRTAQVEIDGEAIGDQLMAVKVELRAGQSPTVWMQFGLPNLSVGLERPQFEVDEETARLIARLVGRTDSLAPVVEAVKAHLERSAASDAS